MSQLRYVWSISLNWNTLQKISYCVSKMNMKIMKMDMERNKKNITYLRIMVVSFSDDFFYSVEIYNGKLLCSKNH